MNEPHTIKAVKSSNLSVACLACTKGTKGKAGCEAVDEVLNHGGVCTASEKPDAFERMIKQGMRTGGRN